jgi:L-aspartate oxidase
LSTTLEAAHSRRRVLHAQDQTGLALVEVLEQKVKQLANVCWLKGGLALQLWVSSGHCCGLQLLINGQLGWLQAGAVVLATGGGGDLFANTTNPSTARGDGVAMAWEAGAVLRDLEFVQFHPTALMHPGAPHFLLSEALRGEGAKLLNGDGTALGEGANEMLPRDQLSRAMVQEMQRSNQKKLWLDLRPVGEAKLIKQFPMILKRCQQLGLTPLQQPLPVAPAAHYWMGGVATNLKAATSLPGLYAIGEVASSGIHGANRLASNSLSECLVMARQLQDLIPHDHKINPANSVKELNWQCDPALVNEAELGSRSLQQICWKAAGVERWGGSIRQAQKQIEKLQQSISVNKILAPFLNQPKEECHRVNPIQQRIFEVLWDQRQRSIVSLLLMQAVSFRAESRGGHFRRDAPKPLPYWCCHSLQKLGAYCQSGNLNKLIQSN